MSDSEHGSGREAGGEGSQGDREIVDWVGTLADSGRQLWERISSELEEGDGIAGLGAVVARWAPVFGALESLIADVVALGRYAARTSAAGEPLPAELVESLRQGTADLIEAFPNVADLYGDIDRFDEMVSGGLDRPGVDDALLRYLTWLRDFVDKVVRRTVQMALGSADRELSPERAEAFLRRLDELLEVVLERWVLPSTLEPGPRRRPPHESEPASADEEKDGSKTGQ